MRSSSKIQDPFRRKSRRRNFFVITSTKEELKQRKKLKLKNYHFEYQLDLHYW